MKKLLTVLALTLMTVVIALTVAGCGTDTSAVDNLVVGGYNEGDETAYNNATYFDFVVCVPGTPFELARFKNVTVTK